MPTTKSQAEGLQEQRSAVKDPLKPSSMSSTKNINSNQYIWLFPALTSGFFAALNSLFAKLTTTSSTTLSTALSSRIPILSTHKSLLELLLRILFFTLNLLGNGVMWTLFTRALKAGDSATRVSVVNTSVNFLVTALLGAGVFGEELGTMWFLGAGCLVIGNVIISTGERREDGKGNKEL